MRASSIIAASVALVAGANAHYSYDNVTYTTEVVTAYTTVCPTPTEIVHGSQTYTVTEVSNLKPLVESEGLWDKQRDKHQWITRRLIRDFNFTVDHLDHHQLPLHSDQACLHSTCLHGTCHVLFHLVHPACFSQAWINLC